MVQGGHRTPLFLSSGRFNLDPFDLYTDEQIWDALERTCLSKTVGGPRPRPWSLLGSPPLGLPGVLLWGVDGVSWGSGMTWGS